MEPDELIRLIRDLTPTLARSGNTVTLSFDEPEQAEEFFLGLDAAITLSVADDFIEED